MTLKGSPPRDPDREAEAQYLLIERIAASEKRHREILAELPEIVILLDEEGCIRFVNEAWERLLGTKPSGLEGRLIVDFIFLDDHRKWNKLIEAAAAASEVPTDREVRLFGVDEKLLWMNAKIRRLDSGEFLCALEDFTTRKRHQEELVKQQRLESIGRLAGGLAHDFNNFLTIILGNLNIAQVKLATGDGVRDELEIAAKACMQASGITKQMLTFSKGGAPITKIASVTELVRESVRLNLHGSKTRVIFDIDEALPPVEIDPDQMHQVFGNLMLNADQAMPEGGDLVIRLRRGSLPSVAGNTSGDDAAVIELIDQGEGIRACDLDYVADPYFTTKKDGTGLGLTSAFWIIQGHHGHLELESTIGEGTTVRIFLPFSRSATTARRGGLLKSPAGVHRGRILIMDDTLQVREVLRMMLESLGHEVVDTPDGKACVEAYRTALTERNPFDLVILDLTVPGGRGGSWTFKQLREFDPKVSAVVASGYSNDNILAEPRAYGFKDRLQKPFLIAKLKTVVDNVLAKGRK